MKNQLNQQDVQNTLVFLDRCQLQGREAEALVHLKYKYVSILEELKLLAEQKPPAKKPPVKKPAAKKAARKR